MEQKKIVTILAILSVYDKTGLLDLVKGLVQYNVKFLGTGGTSEIIRKAGYDISEISSVTNYPEILSGRVKTLHPSIHGGILARNLESDKKELESLNIDKIDYVICNLYPFKETISKENTTLAEAIEEIDIGGVTLLRAAAKNHVRVTVLSDPNDYFFFLEELKKGEISQEFRNKLALKAFSYTSEYDTTILDYFRKQYASNQMQLSLRYGTNPYQTHAQAFVQSGNIPFEVLCGSPSYINLLDALNSWPLVKEMNKALDLPAAASFKHVSPAGAAVGIMLSEIEKKVYFVEDIQNLSHLACAYARARGADRMSSFGDWIALSSKVDLPTAKIISREVSDGIIAPDYEEEALEILKKKKGGKYCILKMDNNYEAPLIETRQVYGVSLQQSRNNVKIDSQTFKNIVSKNKTFPKDALTDLIVATITLKYTQSNSVGFAKNGMIIGLGAGQQSRIHCSRLAGTKAENWWLRHHPKILEFKFLPSIKRPEKSNAIDLYILNKIPDSGPERKQWESLFATIPEPLSDKERSEFIKTLINVTCASDGFFPFPDNINELANYNIKYISAPCGSIKDKEIFEAADHFGMTSIGTGYDLSNSTFSPDGRIFQVEYACKAVENSGIALGIKVKDGIVLAVEHLIQSKLLVPGSNKRIYTVDEHIGVAISGLNTDGKHFVNRAREEAKNWKDVYKTPILPSSLTDRMANYMQVYTLYSSIRPFGVSCIIASIEDNIPKLYMIEPSGNYWGYNGIAIGKSQCEIKNEIEKLKLNEMSLYDAVKAAISIIRSVHNESKDKEYEIEISWISLSETKGKHQLVPKHIVDSITTDLKNSENMIED
ncbi:hypothetical protein PORY_001577 [Pneumocystis oryctolagi]|uniref:Uncharacterized protein n=1 Tax=Pneumocystis oryctolagi TaxID=42067 RepID=A0ACB7CEI3_9ASCO|nr:hypothetical protein PORY_001577 [Pneumocystis oryctolagi]